MKNQSLKSVIKEAEMKETIKQFRDDWDIFLIATTEIAKSKKAVFDSLIKEGFTENQALTLTDLQHKCESK